MAFVIFSQVHVGHALSALNGISILRSLYQNTLNLNHEYTWTGYLVIMIARVDTEKDWVGTLHQEGNALCRSSIEMSSCWHCYVVYKTH